MMKGKMKRKMKAAGKKAAYGNGLMDAFGGMSKPAKKKAAKKKAAKKKAAKSRY